MFKLKNTKLHIEAKYLPFKKLIYLSIAASLFTVLIALVSQAFLPPEVPLYYGLAQGERQLAPSLALILPGTTALAIIILNVIIASLLKDIFLKKMLVLTNLVVCVFSFITTVKIILLIGGF